MGRKEGNEGGYTERKENWLELRISGNVYYYKIKFLS